MTKPTTDFSKQTKPTTDFAKLSKITTDVSFTIKETSNFDINSAFYASSIPTWDDSTVDWDSSLVYWDGLGGNVSPITNASTTDFTKGAKTTTDWS